MRPRLTTCALASLGAALLMLAGAPGPGLAQPQPAAEVPAPDRSLVDAAAATASASMHANAAWPGFWPAGKPFMVTRRQDQTVLLVTPGATPEGYAPVPPALLPAALQGRTYFRRGFPEGVPPFGMQLALPWEGATIPVMPVRSVPPEQFVEFFFHEAFHGFQEAAFTPTLGVQQGFQKATVPAGQLGADFAARAEVERRILADALTLSSAERQQSLLRRYFAVRDLRYRGRPDVPKAERYFEREEGVAQYVGVVVAFRSGGGADEALAGAVRDRNLRRPLHELAVTVESDSQLMRTRLYGTGSALSYFLDRFDVQDWRARIQAGGEESLERMVAQAVGYAPRRDAKLARATLREFGYDGLLAQWRERLAGKAPAAS